MVINGRVMSLIGVVDLLILYWVRLLGWSWLYFLGVRGDIVMVFFFFLVVYNELFFLFFIFVCIY